MTVEVYSLENPYEYVMVTGTAEIDEDQEEANRTSTRCPSSTGGSEAIAEPQAGRAPAIVRVKPERVYPK